MSRLDIRGISKTFGGFRALNAVTMSIGSGERRAVIGANGAGKTTLFNVIGGQLRPTAGTVMLDDTDVTGTPPHVMWRHGLTRTFQRNSVFPQLGVAHNVRLPIIARLGIGYRMMAGRGGSPEVDAAVASVLEQVNLLDRRHVPACELAYGEQRQLELAIALAGGPKILLLDEPTAGMSPAETRVMIDMLDGLPRGITIMIVEHDMDVVFALADKVSVLHMGEVLAEGTPGEVERDERVKSAYLQNVGDAA